MNAAINQRCYEFAETFTNELAEAGIEPLLEDGSLANLSDYNIDVLTSVHLNWSAYYERRAQIVLPAPEMLPVGQPFDTTNEFVDFQDWAVVGFDLNSAALDIGGIFGAVTVSWFLGPGAGAKVLVYGAIASNAQDGLSLGYISYTKGADAGRKEYGAKLKEKALSDAFEKQWGGLIPVVGIWFDFESYGHQVQYGSRVTVSPLPQRHP